MNMLQTTFPIYFTEILLDIKTRNQKSEIRNQKSEIRNQKSEIRNQKSEIRNQDTWPVMLFAFFYPTQKKLQDNLSRFQNWHQSYQRTPEYIPL